ncbi:hypothetical protein C492_08420 [Natronococcus jeotgali DSM 18795]|uniref:Uncharacterized protein n=1 Tax=Natronococcus jeotgali DSM 18795 TaxID=1227498 RepID=L9XKR9_9EURY|nr:hypothetical protein C492_08420 [Natronococcus jeotgali DSM 18795]
MTRKRKTKKTTLAATLTPPATHPLDGAKVTKEQLDHRRNQRRLFESIRDIAQTVSTSSLTRIATSHEL